MRHRNMDRRLRLLATLFYTVLSSMICYSLTDFDDALEILPLPPNSPPFAADV